jgi:4-amino-4-deoxy-L-arabinose transferase-like glycosyltransferase
VKSWNSFFSQRQRSLQFLLVFLFILAFNFLVQIGASPGTGSMSTDSGVFAYCGQQMLQGSLLYRDCWDNKPPLVYALNALAVALGGNTPGGIWFFQAAWVTLTSLAFFLVLRRIWNHWLAFFITFFFLATLLYPPYYQGGNLTETYALLPLILIMGAFYSYLSTGKRRFLIWIGVLAAFAFLFKPTYLALSLSVGLVVLYLDASRRSLRLLRGHALTMLLSAALPLLLVAAYWAVQGAFRDLWFAVFQHNLLYTQAGFSLQSLAQSFQLYFTLKPMASVVSLAFLSAIVFIFDYGQKLLPSRRKAEPGNNIDFTPGQMGTEAARRWHMLSLLLSIPLDFALFAMSGKNFGHYLLVPLPALTASCAYALFVLGRFRQTSTAGRNSAIARSIFVLALAALVYLYANWFYKVAEAEIPNLSKLSAFIRSPNIFSYQPTELEQYILDHSLPSQSVLVWSSDPYLNFVTDRRSPTRYIFPLHLLTPTLSDSSGFGELIEELKEDSPAVIAAQPNPASGMPFFEGNGDDFCPNCSVQVSQGLLNLKNYLESRYTFDRQIWDWYLYLPK